MKKYLFGLLVCLTVFFGCATNAGGATSCQQLTMTQTVCIKGTTADVLYEDVGSTDEAFMLEQMVLKHGITHINLYMFNSGGGAINMLDYVDTMRRLKANGVTIHTYARGIVASAAVPIFVMGDKRFVSPSTWFMMHPGGWRSERLVIMAGPMPECFEKLFYSMEDWYAKIIEERTKMTYEWTINILTQGDTNADQFFFNADEALEWGFADEVW